MNISKILSIAFAPQITPIYWFVILYFKNVKATNNLYSTLIAITFAAAFEIVALLVYATKSKDFFVTERQKRMPLFIVSMLSYFVGTVLLKIYNAPFVIYALMLSYLINTIIAALITKHYSKISTHMGHKRSGSNHPLCLWCLCIHRDACFGVYCWAFEGEK